MKSQLKFYKIDMKYVRDLAKKDDNVMSISPQIDKDIRPFVGVLVLVNGKQYCVPLSSPKEKFQSKKNSIDFVKILDETKKDQNGAYKLLGALNFNNMIPVSKEVISEIDMKTSRSDSHSEKNYKALLSNQLSWCRKNEDKILSHANKTYDVVTNHPEKNRNLTRRCCDFKKLEAVLAKYISKQN